MSELKMPQIGDYIRNVGKLIRIETIPPEPQEPIVDYIFEEISAKIELRASWGKIDDITCLNDFYGLESSIQTAIKEAKEYCSERHITKDSELEVVVIKEVEQFRKRPTGKLEFWNKEYMDFEHLDGYKSTHDLPEKTETIIWSSKKDL